MEIVELVILMKFSAEITSDACDDMYVFEILTLSFVDLNSKDTASPSVKLELVVIYNAFWEIILRVFGIRDVPFMSWI